MFEFLFGPKIPTISTTQLENLLKNKKGIILDVREAHEYASCHIPGAKNVPLSNISNGINTIKKDQELYVICQSGMRSSRASKILKKMGYSDVTNVRGGMSMWRGKVK